MIPVKTLTFDKKLKEWGFNIERRIQRKLELDRWTAISNDIPIGQTSNAGLLAGLPDFNLGIGLIIRGSSNLDFNKSVSEDSKTEWNNSLDITERFTPDITGQITVNTDFAETEVDSRRTNLTRFPLLYPEKRSFFLQGADIYEFGFGLGHDIIPYFSRKIGLLQGQPVPLLVGGKLDGKVGNTNFGGLVTHMGKVDSLVNPTTLGVVRVKQNIWKESTIGFLTTVGDPQGRPGSYTAGLDFTYKTSSFRGDKNFLIGVWVTDLSNKWESYRFFTAPVHFRLESNERFEFSFERNRASLPEGDFIQDLWASRILLNFSSDLQLSSFVQYDNESRNLGTNTRLRWTFSPKGDLFVVYNHNILNDLTERWNYQSNQLILKLTYAIWL